MRERKVTWKRFQDWAAKQIGNARRAIEELEMQLHMLWDDLLPVLTDGQIPEVSRPTNLKALQPTTISARINWKPYFFLIFQESLGEGRNIDKNSQFMRQLSFHIIV